MNGFTMKVRKQLGSCCVFTVLLILIHAANPAESRTIEMKNYRDIMIPETIVQCRASCIERFLLFEMENMLVVSNCEGHSNCAMCWDFCQTLFVEERHIFKSICTNHTCLKGCKYACGYYNYKNWLSYLTTNEPMQ